MSESGLPQCCHGDMLYLPASNRHWCQLCDRRIDAASVVPTMYERYTYEGRKLDESRELKGGYVGSCPIETHVMQMRDEQSWVHSSKDRWYRMYVDASGFYMQDTRSTVGNCVSWWADGKSGYTTELSKAHVFTEKEAHQASDRDTDVPWPKAVVDAASVTHCRMEPLRRWKEENE